MSRLVWPLLVGVAVAACGSRASRAQAEHATLGGDTVAKVGDAPIPASLVGSVAAAQRVDSSRALALLVDDALAAAGARAAGLDKTPEVMRAVTASRARTVVSRIGAAAHEQGPPTDAEVTEVTDLHWLEVDLPERMRVIHAVVIDKKKPGLEATAATLAAALATTEAAATDPDDFEARAKALPHGELEIRVERLEPFVADGRMAAPGGAGYDPDFARGAVPLAPGATSGVVRTKFGWHVIRMIERLPERRVPFEERRRVFRPEVETLRAQHALDQLVADLSTKSEVRVENGVDEMMTDATMTFLGVTPGLSGSATPP